MSGPTAEDIERALDAAFAAIGAPVPQTAAKRRREITAAIARFHREGLGVGRIAAAMRLSRVTVRKHLAAAGLAEPPPATGVERERQDAELRRRWGTGDSLVSLGKRFGISGSAVSHRAMKLGLPRRAIGRPRQP